jgi:beta-galactosidase/beta-glucuronidase
MNIQTLNSPYCHWTIRNSENSIQVEASVPGQVQLDLIKSGIILDPYQQYNDTKTRWVGTTDWIYSTTLVVSQEFERYYLECEGII